MVKNWVEVSRLKKVYEAHAEVNVIAIQYYGCLESVHSKPNKCQGYFISYL